MIKVVCFDLDDTLCDYRKSSELSRRKMFRYAVSGCQGLKMSQFQRAYDDALRDMTKEYNGGAIFLRMTGEETRLEMVSRTLRSVGF